MLECDTFMQSLYLAIVSADDYYNDELFDNGLKDM
jgi:hypothetical protein